MRPTARSAVQPAVRSAGRPSRDIDKWLDLGLLMMSGAAIVAVVMWLQGALAG